MTQEIESELARRPTLPDNEKKWQHHWVKTVKLSKLNY